MKQRLQLAQLSLAELCSRRGNVFYPHYHLAPPAGWMNDPNGLIWFKGECHAFYQHHPMSENQGLMHWGHATSQDMLHWQHELIALSPGEEYDRDGCFSGSAVDDNGVLSLIYTGHVCVVDDGENSIIREVQCLATSHDGIHFEKQGVVLTPPEEIMHFRDPKVWREDNAWWMVLGARDTADRGMVLLYRGESLKNWEPKGILAQDVAGESYMWECPDFFQLGKYYYLMFSPQGLQAQGYSYRNLFQAGTLEGKWAPDSPFELTRTFEELDYGHDFYAPQSFLTEDGRRVMMAWMNMWESPMPTKREGWTGCLTLPRELFERNGRLCQRPVREIQMLRGSHQPIESSVFSNSLVLMDNVHRVELEITWDIGESKAEHYGIRLGDGMRLYIDNQCSRLVLWRYYPDEGLNSWRSIALPSHLELTLRVFIDTSSVEVFVNDGEMTMSSRIYPSPDDRRLEIYSAHGQAAVTGGAIWTLT
ncbi:glycoside hydrolase family 32 protein [Klebsiella michiganensis]|mgnify:CR=1 FL=1|uniref:glycoside hydrolase family 32 protein n=1 Tax=Enterobacteriaceae TaxID=543 RepID=UPI000F83CA8C|nr:MULTISPECIES: glycoside hydrolase family 32 protein [Enterobacteriaceae]MCZ9547069.1 glycoside hydrolase family 32 protein [Klebsiella pneumoniae]MEB7681449.1 glycoside hydrolase family 32 protein [Klebsiella michiganensis]QFQ82643.1 sucrose-6-phosphate hydrolase [Enterobacter roggenkampii]HBQ2180960.1 glycoside hydrolase family 32 protein [Klebsiella pneumoniae]HCI6399743.1 glycoside hydrolase family 32 protein [Klebsiella pneumoniae]